MNGVLDGSSGIRLVIVLKQAIGQVVKLGSGQASRKITLQIKKKIKWCLSSFFIEVSFLKRCPFLALRLFKNRVHDDVVCCSTKHFADRFQKVFFLQCRQACPKLELVHRTSVPLRNAKYRHDDTHSSQLLLEGYEFLLAPAGFALVGKLKQNDLCGMWAGNHRCLPVW